MIVFKENNKNIEEFNSLYDAVGWVHIMKKLQKSL